ncbi:MAG: sigma 54-interacting transcriptional regulator [Candidatus Binatia bacterium]
MASRQWGWCAGVEEKRVALHRILVVHDSPAVRETLAILLGADYEVQTTTVDDYLASEADEPPPRLLIAAGRAGVRAVPHGAAVLWLDDAGATLARPALGRQFSPRQLRQRVAAALARSMPPTPGVHSRLEPPFVPADVARTLAEATRSALPLHVSGEPGVGKRAIARAVHAAWGTSALVAVDALDLDRALNAPPAGAGTLFIDRVDLLAPAAQQQLLAGMTSAGLLSAADGRSLRVITAAATDLGEALEAGGFSSELYYRLTLLAAHLPPLRARREDIAPLARQLAADFAAAFGRGPVVLGERALARLSNYLWFGNIAELEAVLARTVACAHRPVIEAEDLLFDGTRLMPAAAPIPKPEVRATGLGTQQLDLIINELAHEFKNPLVTLKTFAHHLSRADSNGINHDQAARLTGEAVARIDQTLENLLEFTRLDAPAVQTLGLAALLDPVLEECRFALAKRGIRVENDSLPATPVTGDPQQISYALGNLLRALARDLPSASALHVAFAPPANITIRLPDGVEPLGNHLATLLGRTADTSQAPPLGVAIANAVLSRNGAQLTVAPEDPSTIRVRFQPADADPRP